jgi:hypothetical protein
VTTVLTTIHVIIEKVDATHVTNVTDVIDVIDLIDATNAKKKSAENALEQIAKKYAVYPYVIHVNTTTKIKKTINVYS